MQSDILGFIIRAVQDQERLVYEKERNNDPVPPTSFMVVRAAKQLVEPCQNKASHHRERENYYTIELEKAEKKLREEGVSVEVVDPRTGQAIYMPMQPGQLYSGMVGSGQIGNASVCSGSIASGSFPSYVLNYGNHASIPQQNFPTFRPKVNQEMLSAVESAKNKMLEHRGKAEGYEQYARAFSCEPEKLVKLTLADVTYFGLEG